MNAPIPEIRPHDGPASASYFEVPLIEEPLQCEKTGMPILELLAALRRYHQARDLSHQERFGTPDLQSRQVLAELGRVQQTLRDFTSLKGGSGEDFLVEASLNLKMVS